MAVDDEREVKASVGLNVPIAKLRQQSGPSDQQVEGSLSLSPEMAATLSGPGFTIGQITPEKQSIAEGYPTVWTWDVTAKQEGEQKLEVTLYVLVSEGNEPSRIRVESYSQTISVSVRPQTWGEWLDSVGHGLGSVKTIVLTIGTIVTAVLGWFGIQSRKRPPKKSSETDHQTFRLPIQSTSGAAGFSTLPVAEQAAWRAGNLRPKLRVKRQRA
jgi:hypothetical protein